MWKYMYTDELYHHGILGMKWGVRRYQNPDGSLTPAGHRKAKSLASKYARVTGKKLLVKKKSVEQNKPKTLKEMSDKEIQEKINRMRLEDTYASMVASRVPKPKISRGKRFVENTKKNIIGPALTESGRALLTNFIKKKGNDLIYGNDKSKKDDSNKTYEKSVRKLELQNREMKAKIGLKKNTDYYNTLIKDVDIGKSKKITDDIIKNDLGTITIDKKVLNKMK